jgi:hypothetical protein
MASTTTRVPVGDGHTATPDGTSSVEVSLNRVITAVERRPRYSLAVLLAASFVLLLWMGRGLSFFFDEWDFVTHDYGGGIHSLLAAHVGNISVFPVAVYKVLFHLVGLDHYVVFRLVVICLHLVCGALVYVLAARRIPAASALLAAALILFLGAAWEDLLWGFQVGYMLSAAGGLGAWVLLDERRRWSSVAAMTCLVVAVGSSSLGIAIMVGVAVELAWQRRWRDGWIVMVPALLYVLWYLGYGESQVTVGSLIQAPGFAVDLAAAAFGGLAGRGLEWGRPLALFGLVILARRLLRPLPVSPRLAGLLAAGVALWAVTAVARSTISQPEASRYIYLGAIVIVLVGVELLRGVDISARAMALGAVVVLACALSGLTVLHAGAAGLRGNSQTVVAELGALELDPDHVPPTYQPDAQRAPQIQAGPYLHTVRAIGSSPADSPGRIVASDSASRAAADTVLVQIGAATLVPLGSAAPSSLAPAPGVLALQGNVTQNRSCLQLAPVAGESLTGAFTLPEGGVAVHVRAPGAASLAVRRFGETFNPLGGPVTSRSPARVATAADAAEVPWQLQITSSSAVSLCGLHP